MANHAAAPWPVSARTSNSQPLSLAQGPHGCASAQAGCSHRGPAPAAGSGGHRLRRAPRAGVPGRNGASGLLGRHLHPRGADQRRYRDRGGMPRAAGRALGRHRQPPRMPALSPRAGRSSRREPRSCTSRATRPACPTASPAAGSMSTMSASSMNTRPSRAASRRRCWPAQCRGARLPDGPAGHARLFGRPREGPAHAGRRSCCSTPR